MKNKLTLIILFLFFVTVGFSQVKNKIEYDNSMKFGLKAEENSKFIDAYNFYKDAEYWAGGDKEKINLAKTQMNLCVRKIEKQKRLTDSLLMQIELAIFDKAAVQNFRQDYFQEWNYEEIDSLNLSYSNLTYLPEKVQYCKKLKSINLIGNNKLDIDSVFAVLKTLPRITDIKISIDSLAQIPEKYRGRVTGVKMNQIGLKKFPMELFELKNLTYFDVSGEAESPNHFPELPLEAFQIVKLEHLVFEHCEVEKLPITIKNMENLISLKLRGNKLKEIPTELKYLINLEVLGLEKNEFTLFPEEICSLKHLKVLSLFHNQLTELPESISNLTELSALYLWNNQITAIPDEICFLRNLNDLRLYKNKINDINPKIACLGKLEYLDLSHNQIQTMPTELGVLAELKYLSLNNNQIKNFNTGITKLKKLETLDLANNEIPALSSEIKNMKSLTTLKLSNNKIEELPQEIAQLEKLDEITVNNNNLKKLPTSIGKMASLKYVNIENNEALPAEEKQKLDKSINIVIADTENQKLDESTHKVIPDTDTNIVITGTENQKPDLAKIIAEIEDNMVKIQGGKFTMGSKESDDEQPEHEVSISDFYMEKYEVTIQEYMVFVNETKGNYPEWLEKGNSYNINENGSDKNYYREKGMSLEEKDKRKPITGVSWDNAVAYCDWLSKKTNKKYSLPSEAQWEYAAGGGANNRTKWAGTNNESDLGTYAWFTSNSNSVTHEVGTKTKNTLGLHDMSGNVWEWCLDTWHGNYENAPKDGSAWIDNSSSYRVDRGGGWYGNASYCRVARRNYDDPTIRIISIGFRLVRVP